MRLDEDIIDPDLPIVDPHHHLWSTGHHLWKDGHDSYLREDFVADLMSGHNVVQTVFVECEAMYRPDGPVHLRPLGEAEYVARTAEACTDEGWPGVCAGFVGYADLRCLDTLDETLDGLHRESGGRLRGIRQAARWQDEDLPGMPAHKNPQNLLSDPAFRQGLKVLASRNLSYDAWQVCEQLPQLLDVARSVPETSIIINHVGGPIGTGSYRARIDAVRAAWTGSMRELAGCGNVSVKLGGMGMPFMGFGFETAGRAATSAELEVAWRPYVESCIEMFGEHRCMFESNFPVDRVSASYPILWNAFKRITAGCSREARAQLLAGTARRVYRLSEIPNPYPDSAS